MFEKQCKIKVMINKKGHAYRQVGFTLVEILIVISIMVVLAIMMIGIINPSAMIGKGKDSLRKKDLNRIKISFEEYMNDNQHYPDAALVAQMMDRNNCNKIIADFPDLKPWPCDPDGNPYIVLVYPNKFKILTNLENNKDTNILAGWYNLGGIISINGYKINDVNYGVSSTNILWYEVTLDDECSQHWHPEDHGLDTCGMKKTTGSCQQVSKCKQDGDTNCFAVVGDCIPKCQVPCCGIACDE